MSYFETSKEISYAALQTVIRYLQEEEDEEEDEDIPVISANEKKVHIANFAAFFKISAFFIAYVLFYAITVPLIMRYVNKTWNVTSGLVKTLRDKGFSITAVSVSISKITL
jgi:hypothetical protein